MFKNWLIRETNMYFIPHTKAFIDHDGPFTKREATRIALNRANNRARYKIPAEFLIIHRRDEHDLRMFIGR